MVAIVFLSQLLIDENEYQNRNIDGCHKATYNFHCLDEDDHSSPHIEDYSLCKRNQIRRDDKKQTRKAKHHIRFAPTNSFHMIPNRKDYTKSERKDMYMTKQDHKRIQQDILVALREKGIIGTGSNASNQRSNNGNDRRRARESDDECDEETQFLSSYREDSDDDFVDEDDHLSLRGLECFTESYRVEKLCRTKRAIQTIIQRQRLVGSNHLSEEQWLDTNYRPYCIEAAAVAHKAGLRDEQSIPSSFPQLQVMVR